MQNARLDELQAGIKIAGGNINNLRYADDTTLMAESEEELKSLLMKVKEEGKKADSKLNIQKIKIMASGPTTSWQINGEDVEIVSDFIFLDGDCSHELKRCLFLRRRTMTNLNSILKSRDITLLTKVCIFKLSSVAQSCLTLCNPMGCSTPGFPVHLQLPEFTQTHVLRGGDAILPSISSFSSCLQSFPASGSFPLSQFFTSGVQNCGFFSSNVWMRVGP